MEAIAQAFSAILFAVQEHRKTHLRFVHVGVRLLELELQADHHFILLRKTWKIFVEFALDGKTLPNFGDFAMDRLSPSQSYGLQNMQQFSVLSDAEIDEILVEYLSRHGLTTGRTYLAGYLRSRGLRVQRRGFAKVSLE